VRTDWTAARGPVYLTVTLYAAAIVIGISGPPKAAAAVYLALAVWGILVLEGDRMAPNEAASA
jgi:hypothetical protein